MKGPLKYSYKQHRQLLERYLKGHNQRLEQHRLNSIEQYSGLVDIAMLTEQIQMLKNLEYVGTVDGKIAPVQTLLFV